jgi:hypothetical protein
MLPKSQISATWLVIANDSALGINVFRFPPVKVPNVLENTCMQKPSLSDKTIVFFEHEVFKVVVMVTR